MTALHHLALGSPRIEQLAAFYRDVLGLPELRRNLDANGLLRSIWLAIGDGAILMIERSESLPARVEGIGPGFFLLALRVTAAERAAVEQRLERAGSAIESRTEFSSYARDPDGNRIAISHYPD